MGKHLVSITIAFILIGLCLSYLVAGTAVWWAKYYYVWDKAKDCLLVWCLITRVRGYHLLPLKVLQAFLIVRLLWEALAIPNYTIASGREIIDVLFALDIAAIISIYLYTKLIRTND